MPHLSKLCYISQTFMMPQKDREQNISFKFQFLSLLSKRLLGIAPYSGMNLYLVPHVPSALSSTCVSFVFLSSFTFLLGLLSLLPLMCLLSPHFLLYCLYLSIFIGPESDHWLCLSLTHSLTDSLTPV